jgi:mannosyltransferase
MLTKRLREFPDVIWMTVILLIGLGLRLRGLNHQSLWIDESLSWLVGLLPLDESLTWILRDFVHPPFYYLLLRAALRLGQSEFILRLPSAIAGTIAIPVIYKLGRDSGGPFESRRATGLLTAALLAVNPFQIWYSQEARQYGLAFLLALVTMYLFQGLSEGKSGWLGFVIVSALAYVTHYYALLLVLVQLVYVVTRLKGLYRFFRRWYLAQAIAAVPLVLWAIVLFTQETQSAGIAWIPKPSLLAPFLTLWNFGLLYTREWTGPELIAALLLVVVLALSLKIKKQRTYLLLWLFLPSTIILLISLLTSRSFYVDRFFIISLPAFLVLLARGSLVPRQAWVRAGLVFCLMLASTLTALRLPASSSLAKQDWRNAVAIARDNWQAGDLLVLSEATATLPVIYYEVSGLDSQPPPIGSSWSSIIQKSTLEPRAYLEPRTTADPWSDLLRHYTPSRIWLFYAVPPAYNHALGVRAFDIFAEADAETISWLAANQDHILVEHRLPGITVILVKILSDRAG